MGAVFLDLDGTLTDPKPGITGSVQHALRCLDMPVPEADDLEWVIGPALLDSFARLGAPDPAAALEIYRARYTETGLFEAHVYDGIPAALDAIAAAGHRLFLMTAKPHIYARRITAGFGLDTHLEAQFGPELDGTFNDKAELLAHALQRLGVDPRDSVMVGDRSYDQIAARKNGLRFIAADWGYGRGSELDGADLRCATPDGLANAVEAVFSSADRRSP